MPVEQVAPRGIGGRPRKYADEGDFQDLASRVAALEAMGGVTTTVGSTPPVASDDRRYIENCIVAIVNSMGADMLGDGSRATLTALVAGLLITRDSVCANIPALVERERARLAAKGIV